jgi:UDP-3-O-[3-hydroxymyristoyl] glucosamine N-acyltransferase
MGGKSAISDHVDVASRVRLAAKSGVIKNITESGDYGGFPAQPVGVWRRQVASLRRLAKPAHVGSGGGESSRTGANSSE